MYSSHLLVYFVATLASLAVASPAVPKARTTTTRKVTATSTRTTTSAPAPTVTYTHDCSVFIQRWNYHGNLFDVTYYDYYVEAVPTRQQIWIQESWPDVADGEYLPDRQFGSQVLRVLNVANPAQLSPWSATDTGKVTVEWGSYRGNSWDTTTGCTTNPPGFGTGNERATYVCNFRCDVPFGGSGPY